MTELPLIWEQSMHMFAVFWIVFSGLYYICKFTCKASVKAIENLKEEKPGQRRGTKEGL